MNYKQFPREVKFTKKILKQWETVRYLKVAEISMSGQMSSGLRRSEGYIWSYIIIERVSHRPTIYCGKGLLAMNGEDTAGPQFVTFHH